MKIYSSSWNQKQFVDKDSAPPKVNTEGWLQVPQKNPNKTYQIIGHTYKVIAKAERHLPLFSMQRIKNIALGFILTAATLGIAPLFSKSVKQLFNGRQVLKVVEETAPLPGPSKKPCTAKARPFSLNPGTRASLYLSATRYPVSAPWTEKVPNFGGAANVVDEVMKRDPSANCGVMICANSGLPCGKLATDGYVDQKSLNYKTQEESILADVILTQFGSDREKHKAFLNSFNGVWGLVDGPNGTSTETLQGIDFTKATDPEAYNQAFVLDKCQLSALTNSDQGKILVPGRKNEVTLVFADSINANPDVGSPTGTMKRTLNQKAINDYDFFLECIKTKLRAALDAMVAQGVSHAIVGLLSCGIYAPDKWRGAVNQDFPKILDQILNEKVGPAGEIRRDYFKEVLIPEIPKK